MSWIDEAITDATGWEESTRVIDTAWIGDPAIDQDASDGAAYYDTLEMSALKVLKGKAPVKMRVELPGPYQFAQVQACMVNRANTGSDGDIYEAVAVAFSLCVTFPDTPAAAPERIGGHDRLTHAFMGALMRSQPMLIQSVGMWIVGKSQLTEQEKKALSLESGPKNSPAQPSIAATATKPARNGKVARTSGRKQRQQASATA